MRAQKRLTSASRDKERTVDRFATENTPVKCQGAVLVFWTALLPYANVKGLRTLRDHMTV